MTLNRIPPILVCGAGGADYFQSLGGKLLPHEALIEPNAHARWKSWRKELDLAERRPNPHNWKGKLANSIRKGVNDGEVTTVDDDSEEEG
jgi:hypothetical protein